MSLESTLPGMESDPVITYRQMQKKFRRACSQVVLLNNWIQDVQNRYDRAVKNNKRSWRYVTRLNLATLEGVRNMFYEYACRRADQLDSMQDRLHAQGLLPNGDDDDFEDTEPAPGTQSLAGVDPEDMDLDDEEHHVGGDREEHGDESEEETPREIASGRQ